MARAYACRVLALRMVAVKNSMKRLAAFSPASAMTAGRIGPAADDVTAPFDVLAELIPHRPTPRPLIALTFAGLLRVGGWYSRSVGGVKGKLSHNPLYETACTGEVKRRIGAGCDRDCPGNR